MDLCRGPGTPSLRERLFTRLGVKGAPVALILMVLAAGCAGTLPAAGPDTLQAPLPTQEIPATPEIELVFFHPVPGCDSCVRVGLLANETVSTYFGREVAAGNLTFRDVNLYLPENRGIAERYGAYSESLWLGRYNRTGFSATEIVDIWYFAYNHEEFTKYLKGILERELAVPD